MQRDIQIQMFKRLFALRAQGKHDDMLGEVSHIPTSVYTSSDIFAEERQHVFNKHPLLAGPSSNVAEPGQCIVSDWDEYPFIIVRGGDGVLRAFLNQCRHRGAELVARETSRLKAFVCPFHGWSYGLDGKLRSVTQARQFPDLQKENYGLHPVPVAELGGLVWVLPEEQPEFDIAAYLGPFADDLKSFGISDHVSFTQSRIVKKANWKLLIQTYLEGYHVPYLHAETLAGAFRKGVIAFDRHGPHFRLCAGRTNLLDAREIPEQDRRILDFASVYYSFFPNAFFIMHPDYVSLNLFHPLSADRTLWTHELLYRPELYADETGMDRLQKRFSFTNDAVFDNEDFEVSVGVQNGMARGGNTVHTLGLEEGLLTLFQMNVDAAIAQSLQSTDSAKTASI
ncbi:phenylpropionate dioxygenase-like ring-hydroxylating dioxygenase large terminal subunit [Roseibium hamelinense]|uniref:Phenylpropionate dioxygenase-like ring-hydroxylating dioxygenase large terminal subunit n=1 Tax=Roseibium hamelinense TaxID=150831 RepID=A0A562TIL0_9HYPH|nr:aromatic ring-hydroxylating dioxygenase subunit alpha [Roseibium hamelinense]MTI45789.1 aromatic ring-hydroxylating dioxygenase subunit alpha [Roseibium hamelinense]TWI93028.1 phenylpropionate dioxygenase-like ring-hydroxylating dioxygenase large terminal subunit [Roseibium hamelinense]